MPATFRDGAGREWLVEINAWSIKQVKARTGVDLGKLLDDGMRPFGELLGDPALFVDVLFVLVSEQAEKRGVTDEQFGRSLAGDAAEAAALAFRGAYELFCPSRQRKVLQALAAKGDELAAVQTERALKAIAAMDASEAGAGPGSTSGASNSPASSAATPAG